MGLKWKYDGECKKNLEEGIDKFLMFIAIEQGSEQEEQIYRICHECAETQIEYMKKGDCSPID